MAVALGSTLPSLTIIVTKTYKECCVYAVPTVTTSSARSPAVCLTDQCVKSGRHSQVQTAGDKLLIFIILTIFVAINV